MTSPISDLNVDNTDSPTPEEVTKTPQISEAESGPAQTSSESLMKGNTVRSTETEGEVHLFCISDVCPPPSESTETE